MKRSGLLTVHTDAGLKESEIVIHPNDGFDLGLMTTRHPVRVYLGGPLSRFTSQDTADIFAEIVLKNECKAETLEICAKTAAKMAMPSRALLIYDDGRLLIAAQ